MQILSGLDANVKQLQERSQAWDTFNYHMTTWSDYVKSADQKMEIVKKNLENLPIIENQLQNTDFKIQHIFDKTDLINEKFHDITKSILSNSRMLRKSKEQNNKAAGGCQGENLFYFLLNFSNFISHAFFLLKSPHCHTFPPLIGIYHVYNTHSHVHSLESKCSGGNKEESESRRFREYRDSFAAVKDSANAPKYM